MSVTAQKASACIHTLMDTMCWFYTFGFTQSKTVHSTGTVSQLSETFQTQFLWSQIICLGH